MPCQLLKLLLLLLVFVINLPPCWSLCDISSSRRCAHIRRCKKLDPDHQFVEEIASRAAEQAGVVSPSVIEAYQVCTNLLQLEIRDGNRTELEPNEPN